MRRRQQEQQDLTGWKKVMDYLTVAIAVAMVVYEVIAIVWMPLPSIQHVTTFLIFSLVLVYLKEIPGSPKYRPVAVTLLLLSLVVMVYIYMFADGLMERGGSPNSLDIVMGIILVLVVLEATRRTQGLGLPVFALVFMAYAFLGQYLPGGLGHTTIKVARIISWLGIGVTSGIFSSVVYTAANIIFVFLLFGAVLEITGAKEFFMQVGLMVGRKMQGGAAQTSVISSALVGSLTGSAVANVAITGVVTIPLMKRTGFQPEVAGAVEASASSGGILMPPVMGTAAFMMVALTSIPYVEVMKYAVIPALLYYLGVGVSIYVYSRRQNIPAADVKVDVGLMWRRAPSFVIAFAVIVGLLLIGFSAQYAAIWSIVVLFIISLFQRDTRPGLSKLFRGLADGGIQGAQIGVMCSLVGTMIAMLSLTGLGSKLASQVEIWAQGSILLTFFLAMIVSLLLGMASPTAGAYVMVAVIVGPLLVRMGVPLPQAHMFILYFSVIGFLTPPVAPASIVAASIAKAPVWTTSWNACRLVASGFVIPYLFVYDFQLLGRFDHGIFMGMFAVFLAVLIVVVLSGLLFNFLIVKLNLLESVLSVTSIGLIVVYFLAKTNIIVSLAGVACAVVMLFFQAARRRAAARAVSSEPQRRGG